MITLTEKQYNSIPKDYRMIWTNPSNPEYIGKKAALEGSLLAAAGMKHENYEIALLIEDIHFKIIPENTIFPPQYEEFNERYSDAGGNCFSDADSSL